MDKYNDTQFNQLRNLSEDVALQVRKYRSYQYNIDLSLRKKKLEQINHGTCKMYEGKVSLEKDVREMFAKEIPSVWNDCNAHEQTQIVDDWVARQYVTVETSIADIFLYVEKGAGYEKIVKHTTRYMFCDREVKRFENIFDGLLEKSKKS